MTTLVIGRGELKAASRFMAVGDIRYYLNGVLLESSNITTRIAATNGHAMFCGRYVGEGTNDGAFYGIVPANAIKTITAWKGKKLEHVPVIFTFAQDPCANENRAQWLDNVCIFRCVDGKFPDYARVIPPKGLIEEPAYYDAKYMMACSNASQDLGGSEYYAFKQHGVGGSGVAVFNDDCFALVMPVRERLADMNDVEWARTKI